MLAGNFVTNDQPDASHISAWRQQLKSGFNALEAEFLANPNPQRLFKQHGLLVDRLLKNVWAQAHISEHCCLIAVGGYGRGELYPHSDLDLLILIAESATNDQRLNTKLETLIGWLWDIGLNVGHSVRSLNECMVEAKKDLTVQTNLMESRYLTGQPDLYQDFLGQMEATFGSTAAVAEFYQAKLQEQQQRHAKFNDTAYNLEPNIKESPGGLRDLHTILWIKQSLNRPPKRPLSANNIWTLLCKENSLSASEERQIQKQQKHLQTLRIRLHFLSRRREDRLLFDFQNELADSLGYLNSSRKRASEQLMQGYYRSAKCIRVMNEILLKTLAPASASTITPINARYEAHGSLLAAKTGSLLQQRPSAILEAFLLLQQRPELSGMSANLLRNLLRVKKIVNQDFRHAQQNKQLFMQILSQANGVNHALRAMNQYGILGCYIPAFAKIVGQMQHDLFHVYTVDEHILNVLANLRRFAKAELKHEFPLCSQLFSGFDAPHLLYLAALFHDIAKGRGGDHSALGTADARRFCKLHGLSKQDTELVAWLVAAHLKMSATAQKSDLSDPAVIAAFAQFVQNERRLIALYLLTVADIRGTSPLVWNAWKARLLESLFHATKHALGHQLRYTQEAIATRKMEASLKLDKFGLSRHSYEPLWQAFGKHYLIRFESDEIAWHSRLLTPHLHSSLPIVRARLSPSGDGIQVMIYSKDQNDLFARICNFFDSMGYGIVEAKIYTTDHGYALDSFIVLDQSGKSVSYSGLLKFIELELTQKLDAQVLLSAPLKGRISRQVKYLPIQAQITLTEQADSHHHKLEIVANDRPGLLATLAHKLLAQEIELHNAKINTLGNRAEDSFLISARKGKKLSQLKIATLRDTLIHEL